MEPSEPIKLLIKFCDINGTQPRHDCCVVKIAAIVENKCLNFGRRLDTSLGQIMQRKVVPHIVRELLERITRMQEEPSRRSTRKSNLFVPE
eukprot:8543960-Heterocapsa_arctica.AAC.1